MLPVYVTWTLYPFHSKGRATKSKFEDWFDFADWLKQQNEAGLLIVIHSWSYNKNA